MWLLNNWYTTHGLIDKKTYCLLYQYTDVAAMQENNRTQKAAAYIGWDIKNRNIFSINI